MLRIGPAAGRGVSEAAVSIFLSGKRPRAAAVAALVVTGALGGHARGRNESSKRHILCY
ncbi:hypothetical protein DF3PB_20001 [uncultured Defluviicoccus sp.]|uniref:Uncharacterized protein n=1 Tax=metagenome TaxID=256318 RepID=A0A380TBF1_9ZZZZ|nr:hypothetical protein DF3PB_20001 [uncultured Defluviicoccus sp.]